MSDTRPTERLRNRLLAVIAFVLAVGALKASYAVTMPIMFTAVVLAAVWPLKRWLSRHLPGWAAYTLTILVLFGIFAGFALAVYLAIGQVLSVIGQQWPQLTRDYTRLSQTLGGWGVPVGHILDQQRMAAMVQMIGQSFYAFATYLGFIAVLVMLGLPEVPHLRRRLRSELDARARGELDLIIGESAHQVRSYLATTFATSVLTGVACTVFPLATGLDLALVWGLLNFLLNFIPVIGNIIGIIPPTLYALVQYDGWVMPLAVFVGFGVIQLVISNIIYPLLQGRQLSISPVAIIVAMAFWSWVWGIAGALIAIPLTAAIIIVCGEFDRTRWIAALISSDGSKGAPR